MTAEKIPSRRIRILREDVARKIAAGEVIDRPFSVVRELLDNALDAGSDDLSLYLENGGIDLIRLVDNGRGMNEEDLKLCFLPHATSKIQEEADLYKTRTLGFRGEALSSIANCAKLDITSCPPDSPHGYKLLVRAGKLLSLEKHRGKPGTVVEVAELFYNMPARKKFLKRASGETTTCKNIFLDKAVAHPDQAFRLFVNGKLNLFLPVSSSLERIATAFAKSGLSSGLLIEEESVFEDFSLHVVGGRPELTRQDRKFIQIFVNGRRVSEFAFIQAVQYGYSGFMPGKDFPVAFVFININPELVDFNIHPAKKECRFLNLPEVHKALVALIKSYLNRFSITIGHPENKEVPVQATLQNFSYPKPVTEKRPSVETVFSRGRANQYGKPAPPSSGRTPLTQLSNIPLQKDQEEKKEMTFHYLGQVFNLFLAVEYGDTFLLVDQHAAHEKILFNKLCREKPVMQELLFPISFETEGEEQKLLDKMIPELETWGIALQKMGENLYEITALAGSLQNLPGEELIAFLKNQRGSVRELQKTLYSMAACKGAIKDGDPIDHLTAVKLLEEAFTLEDARCPHGRPIWHALNRGELFKLTGRK